MYAIFVPTVVGYSFAKSDVSRSDNYCWGKEVELIQPSTRASGTCVGSSEVIQSANSKSGSDHETTINRRTSTGAEAVHIHPGFSNHAGQMILNGAISLGHQELDLQVVEGSRGSKLDDLNLSVVLNLSLQYSRSRSPLFLCHARSGTR